MKLRPLQDRVVVRRVDSQTVTKGGIVIPDSAAEKADQGTVLAVGPGRLDKDGNLVKLGVFPDSHILFGRHSGQTVKLDGEEFLILKEDDILAVINQGE